MDAEIFKFPENKVVRRFEKAEEVKPSNEKDIIEMYTRIMDQINEGINFYDMGEATDSHAVKEYCLVQQAVLAMVQKLYDHENSLHDFADHYIEIIEHNEDGLQYKINMPALAFLNETGQDYTIIDYNDEEINEE